MTQIVNSLTGLPVWVYAAAVVAVALVVAVIFLLAARRRDFVRRLRLAAEDPEQAELLVRQQFSDVQLLRRSKLIENVARRYSPKVVGAVGVDELWQRRLLRSMRTADFHRVLEFSWETGLFACFLAALRRPKLRAPLFARIDDSGDLLVLRSIALAGRGEEFDGREACEMFSGRIDEVREMTGDPDWPVRYFAVKILLYDHDPRSERILWDCSTDAAALVRRVIVEEFEPTDRNRLFEHLYGLLLDDPAFEVRRAARRRIDREFPERYDVDPAELSPDQAVHVLEHLDEGSKADENTSVVFLEHQDRELRFPAALFLERRGILERMFRAVDFGDRDAFERTSRLLDNAADVNVTGFLEGSGSEMSVAMVHLAAGILARKGPVARIHGVAAAGFRYYDEVSEGRDDLLEAVLSMIESRGDEAALSALREEMLDRRHDKSCVERILSHIPSRAHLLFSDAFLTCLTDPRFEAEDALVTAVARMPYPDLIPELMEIIKAGRETYSHRVRVRALETLGAYGDLSVLQFVLENLPVLPSEEAREFARKLTEFADDRLDTRVWSLLAGNDAAVRASIISALPTDRKSEFAKPIKEAVNDADPDVRIAALWALAELEDKHGLAGAGDRLRDPVERVRSEAARALAAHGGEQTVKQFRELLGDENEVDTVKAAALRGLGASPLKTSIDVLVDFLEEGPGDLESEAVHALARKRGARDLEAIVDHLKDAEPALRERLIKVFRVMASEAEQVMVDLLREDIPSLRPVVTDILEKVGYVESLVRRLSHRDPAVRRHAAEVLSLIATPSAFRGIVLAARDPDQEVRVRVTRALESLNTESGRGILEDLQSDPDKRVRKYTTWALQRARAKSA
ncbi:MAG: HEAT repeat domain-containing protein [Spirochaetaceae bacterium]